MEDIENSLSDVINELGEVVPMVSGKGLISYRKYLWAAKFMEEKIERLKEYKEQVVNDIDNSITAKQMQLERIRGEIMNSMAMDNSIDTTTSGGKSISLPDIASVSLSKVQDKIKIIDANMVMEKLGDDFKKVKYSLDVTKAKAHILETHEVPEGASVYKDRTLTIRFKNK